MARFQTLIIGAGFSGLAAGIRLARFGVPVCILERHAMIGGLNSFYRLRGRNFDVGLHAVTNYQPPGNKGGPLHRVLRQLRLNWEDFALVPQRESGIRFPGRTLRFSNDPAQLETSIAQQFPGEIDGFRRLCAFADAHPWGAPVEGCRGARQLLARFLGDPGLVEMLLCPVMFYGSATPHDMPAASFVVLFRSIFREGLARPYEGVRRLLKHLVRQYKSSGGQLWLHRGVRRIVTHRGRAVGVILDSGEELECDVVLSSAGLVETRALCDGPDWRAAASGAAPAGELTFFETILVLGAQPAELGFDETILFFSNTPRFYYGNPEEPCDLRSGIVCTPNNFAYDRPLAEAMVRLTVLANKDHWMALPQEEYARAKAAWQQRILEANAAHLGRLPARVIDVDAFTPRTIRHYTGHANGAVYGSPEKCWNGATPIKNLFLCGTDQGYLGVIGAMLSGIMMANQHVLLAGQA